LKQKTLQTPTRASKKRLQSLPYLHPAGLRLPSDLTAKEPRGPSQGPGGTAYLTGQASPAGLAALACGLLALTDKARRPAGLAAAAPAAPQTQKRARPRTTARGRPYVASPPDSKTGSP